jgi:hypothetical protein
MAKEIDFIAVSWSAGQVMPSTSIVDGWFQPGRSTGERRSSTGLFSQSQQSASSSSSSNRKQRGRDAKGQVLIIIG